MLVEAHRTGSLCASLSLDVWRGFACSSGETSRRRRPPCARGSTRSSCGVGAVARPTPSPRRFWPGRSSSAATCRVRDELSGAGEVPIRTASGANWWRRSELELLIAEGRNEEAVGCADEYAAHLGRRTNPAFGHWRSLKAVALDRLGRREEAIALVREELDPARRWGARGTVGRSLRVIGELERANGLGHLEEAVGALEGTPARLEQAKVLCLARYQPTARSPPERRPRAPAPRVRARRGLRRRPACRARPLRDLRERGASPVDGAHRRSVAHAERAASRRPGRRGRKRPRHRPSAVCHAEDRRDTPHPGLPQARRRLAAGAGSGPRAGRLARADALRSLR